MRKLKLQVQMSIDGFVAGPNGEMDWMEWNWDDKLKDYVTTLTDTIDTIVMGRKLAQGFIGHWAAIAGKPDDPEYTFARKMTDAKKVVFSRTPAIAEWPNTEIASGDLTTEINTLKAQEGKDIIVYGGAQFVSALIKADLIDAYHLFVNPAALGQGMTIFADLEQKKAFEQSSAQRFACGVVVLEVIPKPSHLKKGA